MLIRVAVEKGGGGEGGTERRRGREAERQRRGKEETGNACLPVYGKVSLSFTLRCERAHLQTCGRGRASPRERIVDRCYGSWQYPS